MEPTITTNTSNTHHADGTVSHWDVYRQQWIRCPADAISDQVLSSMTDDERDLIDDAACRETARALNATQHRLGTVDADGTCNTCGGSGLYSPGIECGDCDASERLHFMTARPAVVRSATDEIDCGTINVAEAVASTCRRIIEAAPTPEEIALRTYLEAMVAAGWTVTYQHNDENGKWVHDPSTPEEIVRIMSDDVATFGLDLERSDKRRGFSACGQI